MHRVTLEPTSPASTTMSAAASPVSGFDALSGSTIPRLWTPPLRDLTPETSYGFELIEFAEEIGEPFDPWQCWLAIHIGELLPNGNPRFRTILILVSRQNGKTRFCKVWALWCLFVDMAVPGRYEEATLLGISSKLDYAKQTWAQAVRTARRVPDLACDLPKNAVRTTNGEQELVTIHDTRYKIAASNEDAGRSLTVQRLFVDELRRQKDWVAWDAAEPTTSAVTDAQIIAASNQGDDTSVVLDALRGAAITFIELGEGDPTLGLFEWSAPPGSDPTDVSALLQSNPNAVLRLPLDALINRGRRAKAAGGKQLAGFKTESMCMRVHVFDPAIDPDAWDACMEVGSMDDVRDRVGLVLDVAVDQSHATLTAAAELSDGRVRIEVVKAWSGRGCITQVERELPALVRKVKARAFGWFPGGPAATLQAELATRKRDRRRPAWPPPGVVVKEITTETCGVCMALGELVIANRIVHSDDPLQNQHMLAAQKLHQGDRWRFQRVGSIPIDGSYAAAGAVHVARTLPPSPGKPRLVMPSA